MSNKLDRMNKKTQAAKQAAKMWLEGKSPQEIAEALKKPVAAIYRILKSLQDEVAYESGRDRILKPLQDEAEYESGKDRYPLRGTLLFYKDPTASVGEDDWKAMK